MGSLGFVFIYLLVGLFIYIWVKVMTIEFKESAVARFDRKNPYLSGVLWVLGWIILIPMGVLITVGYVLYRASQEFRSLIKIHIRIERDK